MKEIKDVINEKVFGVGTIAGYKILYGVGIKDLKSMSHLIDMHKPDAIIRVNKNSIKGYTFIITSTRAAISANQIARFFLELGIDNGIYTEYTKAINTDNKAYVYAANINIFSTTCRSL